MKNSIQSVIDRISCDKGNPKLVYEITKEIDKELGLKRNKLWRWKRNESQPDLFEVKKLLKVLNRYDSSLTIDDLIHNEKSVEEIKVKNLLK